MKTLIAAFAGLAALVVTSASASAASRAVCDAEAREYANRVTRVGGDALAGAAFGAGIGAVLGGIGGRPGLGAALGAGLGAGAGAATNTREWNAAYNNYYQDCRARPVNQVRRGRYEPWTDEWFYACSRRYGSFNEETGYWLHESGEYRFCNL